MKDTNQRVLDILFLKDYVFNSDYFDFIMKNSPHNISLKKEKGKIYDVIFCLNQVMKNTHVETYNGNIFAIMQEPGAKNMNMHQFMYEKLNQYDRVFSSIVNSENTIQDIPYLEWHIKASHKDIINLVCPLKNKLASCITSNQNNCLPGHKKRYDFVWNFLVHQGLDIDFYGKGINYIEKKKMDYLITNIR